MTTCSGSLVLLIGHYSIAEGATFVTWNGNPVHFEWDHKPTGQERQTALAEAQKLVGRKLKMWGLWHNPRTNLFFVSAKYTEAKGNAL